MEVTLFLSCHNFSRPCSSRHPSTAINGAKTLTRPPTSITLFEVATILATDGGITDLQTLMAAVLHDTIEDTETTPQELETRFGRKVRTRVAEVTDDKTLPKEERKRLQVEHAAKSSLEAKMIKFGDKISNVQDVTHTPPAKWTLERRREYLDGTQKVLAGCRGCNSEPEAYYDQVLKDGRVALEAEDR